MAPELYSYLGAHAYLTYSQTYGPSSEGEAALKQIATIFQEEEFTLKVLKDIEQILDKIVESGYLKDLSEDIQERSAAYEAAKANISVESDQNDATEMTFYQAKTDLEGLIHALVTSYEAVHKANDIALYAMAFGEVQIAKRLFYNSFFVLADARASGTIQHYAQRNAAFLERVRNALGDKQYVNTQKYHCTATMTRAEDAYSKLVEKCPCHSSELQAAELAATVAKQELDIALAADVELSSPSQIDSIVAKRTHACTNYMEATSTCSTTRVNTYLATIYPSDDTQGESSV